MQYLMKIGRSAAKLSRIFDFQNDGRPPSRIWYDVISDNPRLVFDVPNILLKLHVDRVYTLQDIAIFIFGPSGLKLPIQYSCTFLGNFGGYYPINEFLHCHNPQTDRPWAKTLRMSHKP